MAVRRKGDRWIVEFMQRGIRVFHRLPPGATKHDAQQLESLKRRQIFNAVDLKKLPDPLLSKVIDEWLENIVKGRKSEGATRSHAARANVDCAGKLLSDLVGAGAVIKGRKALSPATINRRLCILKAVAKYAFQKGYVAENLSPKITLLPENNARHVYLADGQIPTLLKCADTPEGKAFIAWAVFTGMRQGEILSLCREDVDEALRVIRIRDSKVGEPRAVPLIAPLLPYLSAIPFRSHKRTLYALFEKARDKAGFAGLRFHDLRHTAASMLINSGADLYIVGTILGHKSTQTTKRYAHLSVERQRTALERAFGGDGEGKAKTVASELDGKARKQVARQGIGAKVARRKPRKEAGKRRRRARDKTRGA